VEPALVSETCIFRPNSRVVLGAAGAELVGKGARAAGSLAVEERRLGVAECLWDFCFIDLHGTHCGRRGPFPSGGGEGGRGSPRC
jgi:hypothetical protein